ncbi:MAG: FAD-dependent oxidoreductase [Desulfurobacteriaceae bacterium]
MEFNFPDFEFHIKGKRVLKERKKAFYLSLILPGLGQIYQRRFITGIFFLFTFSLPFYYLYLIGFKLNYGSISLIVALIFLYILQAIDAKRGATRETSPCEDFCPANVNIPSFMSFSSVGKFKKAFGVFVSKAPFPLTLGEICPATCETKCGILPGRSLKIREVHKEFGRLVLKEMKIIKRNPIFPVVNRKVAIIGGGPAGLSAAYYLASCGVKVDIFEKEKTLGGLLNLIPDFKLDKELLQREIEFITSFKNLRVFLKTNVNSKLSGYDFIVIAVGSQKERKFDIPVEGKSAVVYPLSFLKFPPDLQGKKVAIVGAGDTAFDIARLVLRLGGKAFVFYRGSSENFRANPREVNLAIREGVEVFTNCLPEVIKDNRITFSCGSISFDYLVPAIGFEKDKKIFETFEISGEKFFESNVFVVGDALNGMTTAIEAIKSGRVAAEKILKKLGLGDRIWFTVDFYEPKKESLKGDNLFIVSESSLCQHCGEKVKS